MLSRDGRGETCDGEAASPRRAERPLIRGRALWRRAVLVLAFLALLWQPQGADPVRLEDFFETRGMTPKKFASYFSEFTYTYRETIQTPEEFLARRDGDCDDYAVLADVVLAKHGYTTRLIHVRLAGLVAHVVCYVVEDRVYLDFNNRTFFSKTEKCAPNLRDVAAKVARSFSANWTSVSEFTCQNGIKRIVRTIAKVDPPSSSDEIVETPKGP